MAFLPSDYKEKSSSRYMKLEEGPNRLRILGTFEDPKTAIMGVEYWVTTKDGRRPRRLPQGTPVPANELELNPKTGEPEIPKFFWALKVWNHEINDVNILELTQKTIRNGIVALSNNPKWGDPSKYDITITRIQNGDKTEYNVMPEPKEALTEDMLAQIKATYCDVSKLFINGDPWMETANESVNPDEVISGIDKLKRATPGKIANAMDKERTNAY